MTEHPDERSRYVVTETFSVQTPGGKRTFAPGTVLSLVTEKAAPLIMEGYLREVAPIPDHTPKPAPNGGLLIQWQTATGRKICLADSPKAAAQAPGRTATFQLAELDIIRGSSPELLNLIIDVKEVFSGSVLEQIEHHHSQEVSPL